MKNVLKKNYYSSAQQLLSRRSQPLLSSPFFNTCASRRSSSSQPQPKSSSVIILTEKDDDDAVTVRKNDLQFPLPSIQSDTVTKPIHGPAWSSTIFLVPSALLLPPTPTRKGRKEDISSINPSPFSSSPSTTHASTLPHATQHSTMTQGETSKIEQEKQAEASEAAAAELVVDTEPTPIGATASLSGSSENRRIKRRGNEGQNNILLPFLDPRPIQRQQPSEEHHKQHQDKVKSIGINQVKLEKRRYRIGRMSCGAFGYRPEEWCEQFPIALNGHRQSPIDICSSGCKCVATSDHPESLINLQYPESIDGLSIKNTGHGWVVNIPEDVSRNTCLTGGPLNGDKYILEQFHCHWGSNCSCGSEHTVDGKSFAAELHLVHWNSSRFSSFSEAASQDKGLAVLGVFLDTNGVTEPNSDLSKVTDRMKDIKYKNSTAPLDGSIVIQNLLPADKSYWTYDGSLTTPPLYESVTWLVLKNPIQVTEDQVAQFRELCFHEESERPADGSDVPVVANFRPTQPIHERVVSFIG